MGGVQPIHISQVRIVAWARFPLRVHLALRAGIRRTGPVLFDSANALHSLPGVQPAHHGIRPDTRGPPFANTRERSRDPGQDPAPPDASSGEARSRLGRFPRALRMQATTGMSAFERDVSTGLVNRFFTGNTILVVRALHGPRALPARRPCPAQEQAHPKPGTVLGTRRRLQRPDPLLQPLPERFAKDLFRNEL